MIGVDTNVLIRLFITEDPRQNELARSFFAERSPKSPAHISLVVMAEFAWVLSVKYKYGYDRIGSAVQAMLDSDDFVVEHRAVVEWALGQFTRSKIDFSDLLIARANEVAECPMTVTFDHDAAKYVSGMELLK
jgi:predicted nucleic-acid-binding protein